MRRGEVFGGIWQSSRKPTLPKPGTINTGFGLWKLWKNLFEEIEKNSKLAFVQVGEKFTGKYGIYI